ncbi:hypothetical protein C8J57DRAFT_1366425 [Mycena rebaudengoi]|nr:hypothetical protein C8J57DRAFT_1366425 [Mycena rebaudengoi]
MIFTNSGLSPRPPLTILLVIAFGLSGPLFCIYPAPFALVASHTTPLIYNTEFHIRAFQDGRIVLDNGIRSPIWSSVAQSAPPKV